MKEIGGYLEAEHFRGNELYPHAMKLNLGRTAAALYLKETGARKVWLPRFLCTSVTDALKKEGMELLFYGILPDFTPDEKDLPDRPMEEDECLFVVNFYGQIDNDRLLAMKKRWGNVFLDFTHSFFQEPPAGMPALMSVRKFFGVTDGAYLFAAEDISLPKEQDESHTRFAHVLGRYERNASEFYRQMLENAESYVGAEPKRMSALTENLMRGIDYEYAASVRNANFGILDELLESVNELKQEGILKTPEGGAFCYPLLIRDGSRIRKELAKENIYVPTYWRNVIDEMPQGSLEYRYASDILALPCDQRYGASEMKTVAEAVLRLIGEE